MNPFISICIPAFKNYGYLKRLLESIKTQDYSNFEVVITDDSPGDELRDLCKEYEPFFDLNYYKNVTNLNTPENWNEAVGKSKYEWVKIMHDDDWFTGPRALSIFSQAIVAHPAKSFFFSAYQNVYEATGLVEPMKTNLIWQYLLSNNIEILISRNVVGPPSVVLYKKSSLAYDASMKYVVDIDFYSRYCASNEFLFIPDILLNVGIHAHQVTKYTHGVEEIHLKESILMLNKKPLLILKNIVVFDGWWRLVRNFNVMQLKKLVDLGLHAKFSNAFNTIVSIQQQFSQKALQNGYFSKLIMVYAYIRYCLFGK